MNQLNNISLTSAAIHHPTISGGTFSSIDHIGTSAMASISLSPDCVITIGDFTITGESLARGLQLLDKIIVTHYPEELI